ncbi:hypothetical protein M0R45_030212 [Rubus argutus]|uniref:Zinc knuckle CX2CX4HX4C domain-containing protein n=1 Tax=Rubus argutus TaxID=59490 RepID=A0AAW1WAE8_RUBAR
MAKVLEREPWDFDRSLILMGVLREEEAVTAVDLKTAVFWVQIHGVPLRFRTPEVAEDIGSVVGGVVDVGRASGEDCVGRFLRVRVRMDVTQPLLRRTVVPFPGIGDREVDFRYEYLPEFCQECGLIGHPTRVCDERLGLQQKKEENRPYKAGLRAECDIHGRRLGPRGGKGRWDGISSGSEASDSFSGSMSRSVGDGSGEQKIVAMGVDNESLLLEGPLQDTAISPCKREGRQSKSKGVLIAERFAVQQRAFRVASAQKPVARDLFPSSGVEGAKKDVQMRLDMVHSDVVLTAETKQLSKKPPNVAVGKSDIKKLGSLLKAGFSDGGIEKVADVKFGNDSQKEVIEGMVLGLSTSPVFSVGVSSGGNVSQMRNGGRKFLKSKLLEWKMGREKWRLIWFRNRHKLRR